MQYCNCLNKHLREVFGKNEDGNMPLSRIDTI